MSRVAGSGGRDKRCCSKLVSSHKSNPAVRAGVVSSNPPHRSSPTYNSLLPLDRLEETVTVAERLPYELWDLVVAQLPANEVQRTALALSRALPRTAHVSNALFWRHVRVNGEGQAWQIIQKLRQEEGAAECARTVATALWR